MDKMSELLKIATVRTETIKLDCLANTNLKDMEFTLKEMTIRENREYRELARNVKDNDISEIQKFACKKVMVNPEFFTDEEYENMNGIGEAIVNEIFYKIPTIGMTQSQKEQYNKTLMELATLEASRQEKTEEEQKKPKKRS